MSKPEKMSVREMKERNVGGLEVQVTLFKDFFTKKTGWRNSVKRHISILK